MLRCGSHVAHMAMLRLWFATWPHMVLLCQQSLHHPWLRTGWQSSRTTLLSAASRIPGQQTYALASDKIYHPKTKVRPIPEAVDRLLSGDSAAQQSERTAAEHGVEVWRASCQDGAVAAEGMLRTPLGAALARRCYRQQRGVCILWRVEQVGNKGHQPGSVLQGHLQVSRPCTFLTNS